MHFFFTAARWIALSALLLPMWAAGQGQQGSGSPYSAYGLGELVGAAPMAQASMGGLGAAVVDNASLIVANPASYTGLVRPTFEMGLGVRTSSFATTTATRLGRRTEIMGLSLGIPFAGGRWGLAIALRPISRVNYELNESLAIPNGTGEAQFVYTGDGGLNHALVGAGRVVSQKRDSLLNGHRLSIGANLGYLFGRIENSRTALFPSGQGLYASRMTNSMVIRDPTVDIGAQYQGDLRRRIRKEDEALYYLVGVAAELPVALRTRRSDVAYTYGFSSSGVEIPLDTAYYSGMVRGQWTIPLGFKAGVMVFAERWSLGAEYRQRDWTTLSADDDRSLPSGVLANSTTVVIGGSYQPSKEISGSLWSRTTYRAGLRTTNEHVKVAGTQLQDRCVTVGASFPMMALTTRSRLNIGGEFGERGTQANGLIRERYMTLLLGLTITPDMREGWFRKRRID